MSGIHKYSLLSQDLASLRWLHNFFGAFVPDEETAGEAVFTEDALLSDVSAKIGVLIGFPERK